MFELAALGLLQQEPLHGYRLKQQLELFMSSCISVNYGTIYPLLKRLEQQGAIVASGEETSSRKVYQITEQGRLIWKQKMMEHPHESWVNARSRFMIKLFFFNHLQPVERLKLMNHRLMVCRLRAESIENQQIEEIVDDSFQVAVWHHHLVSLHAEINWLEELLRQELAESTPSNCLDHSDEAEPVPQQSCNRSPLILNTWQEKAALNAEELPPQF